jgi:serine/threonine-protein kinase
MSMGTARAPMRGTMVDQDDIPQHLKLLRLLGQGGMGSVWIAKHANLETRVAVKFLSREIAQTPDGAQRFRREAVAAAQIRSPHVVQVFDHGLTSSNTPYIVMELLAGEDLEHRLARDGPLSTDHAIAVVTQAARALANAHEQGIVHRDIKPENIFLLAGYDDIFVKVLDFGIAKNVEQQGGLTATGVMIGTPAYASPEQLQDAKHVDERTDLWSMGVVAYEALTGRLPFEGANLVRLVLAVREGKFVPPSTLRADLPAVVDRWFERALALEPEARFASAREMADAFAVALRAGGAVDTLAGADTWVDSKAALAAREALFAETGEKPPHRAASGRIAVFVVFGVMVMVGLTLGVVALLRAG